MKIGWIASLAVAAATTGAFAQTTIYKHVDESGRITYTNRPMKGATVMDLEPITLVPGLGAAPQARAVATLERVDVPRPKAVASQNPPTLASIEPQVQRSRDNDR